MKAIDNSELVTVTGGQTAVGSTRTGSTFSRYGNNGSMDPSLAAARKITTDLEVALRDQRKNPNNAVAFAAALAVVIKNNRSIA